MPIKWLRPEQVKDLNRKALYEGEPHGLNPGSDLEGALNRPRGHHYYEGTESLCELAALYAIALAKAHAFQDGNKRTALLTIRAFLRANGLDFDYGAYDEEAAEMMTAIATESVEQTDVVDWIRRNTEGAT
jgi:death-on-curing protein